MGIQIHNLLERGNGISLKEIDSVSLLSRIDTKYIFHSSLLPSLLSQAISDYRVLEVDQQRVMNYESLYFDTPENTFFFQHHNGKIKRTKIRFRKYIDSNLCFFEIKTKNGRSNTEKKRVKTSDIIKTLNPEHRSYVAHITGQEYDLLPKLGNRFQRITLVNIERKERFTIDINLAFEMDNEVKLMDQLVVLELKQEKHNVASPIVQLLRKQGIRPGGFSKYCVGRILFQPDLKHNRFKPKLFKLHKIMS